MTREEVIALARKAGIVVTGEAVWRLCELVAAAEREACARVCEVHGSMAKHAVWMAEECAAAIRARGNDVA